MARIMGFAEPAFGAVFGKDAEAAVDFHGPLGAVGTANSAVQYLAR